MASREFKTRLILTAKNQASGVLREVGRDSSSLTGKLGKIGLAATAAGAALGAAFAGSSILKAKEFGAAIGDLKAITGATGAELQFLEQQAKRLGATTTFTASQAAEGFKLIASAKPDLLGNKEALSAVTEQALLLAEASGVSLPEAAEGLGEALNQFGAGADQAAKFVDILAAGSQKGASEIPAVSEALKNSGVAAKSAGLSFQETVAAIETLATTGIKGSDAGTKLRAILVKLQTQANDEFNPAVVGMSKALENLEKANLTVTEKTELFGERSIVVADALVQNRDKFDGLTKAVDENGIAAAQAQARYDNLEGDFKRFGSAMEALQITTGEKFNPVMRDLTQLGTDILTIWNGMERETPNVTDDFNVLANTLKGLATAAFGVKELFGFILNQIGRIGELISVALAGEFEKIPQIFQDSFDDAKSRIQFTAEFAENIFSEDTKQVIADKFSENVTTPVLEAAADLATQLPQVMTAGEQAEAEAEQKALEQMFTRLERFRNELMTKREIEQEHNLENLMLLDQARAEGLLTEEKYNQAIEAEMLRHQTALTKIDQQGIKTRADFEKASMKMKTKTVLGDLETLTAGVAQNNKTLFKINKIAAIASALVAMPEHISTTMAKYPYPVSIAMGALAAASSLAQIQAIKSTSFGGGGTGTTPSAAGTVPTVNDIPLPSALSDPNSVSTEQTRTRIDVVLEADEGTLYTPNQVRKLIQGLDEAFGDGAELRITGI